MSKTALDVGTAGIRKRRREKWDKVALLFIAPYLAYLGLFIIQPLYMGLAGSVAEWDILFARMEWVGFENYARLFRDPKFYDAIGNTLIYLVVQIPLSIIFGLMAALLLNQRIRFRAFFRALYFLPVITGSVVLAIVWTWIYSESGGVLNYLLSFFGVAPIAWLNSESLSMYSISLMKVWTDVGFYAVIFLAALQAIPSDLIEAARVDGATPWNIFWHIKRPLLNSTIVFAVIMATIWGMQIFAEPYLMTRGGPLGSTTTMTLYLYREAFDFSRMGYASAIGVVVAVMILAVSLVERKLIERDVY